jgi:hypothetical protein
MDPHYVPPAHKQATWPTLAATYRIFKRYFVALLPVAALWKPATGAAGAAARAADFLATGGLEYSGVARCGQRNPRCLG